MERAVCVAITAAGFVVGHAPQANVSMNLCMRSLIGLAMSSLNPTTPRHELRWQIPPPPPGPPPREATGPAGEYLSGEREFCYGRCSREDRSPQPSFRIIIQAPQSAESVYSSSPPDVLSLEDLTGLGVPDPSVAGDRAPSPTRDIRQEGKAVGATDNIKVRLGGWV